MKPSTPIAVSKWMWCLYPCLAEGPVDVNNTILVDCVWIERIRKNNASSPSETEMPYAVPALSSPCEPIAIKIKAWTGFAIGTISDVGVLCSYDKPKNYIGKQGWLRVPVVWQNFANFNRRWGLNINSW